MISSREIKVLLTLLTLALLASLYRPYDLLTWFLETAPVFIGLPILITTYRRHPLTPLVYRLLLLHALILILGAHYTYARVPLGFWLQDLFDFSRNHYDRIGHIAQGFIPAILAREILIRRFEFLPKAWVFFLVVSVCLAFSALYELIEWWVAIAANEASTEFLGTQGDVWDTQWDMFMALGGAIAAQLLLASWHDRQLKKLGSECKKLGSE